MKYFCLFMAAALLCFGCNESKKQTASAYISPAPEFCKDSAFQYVAEQCAFGPRTMNSAAHDSCGNYIVRKFEEFGATVYNQYADGKLYDGKAVKIRNIIAAYNPAAEKRVIISGHWDSREWADRDADEAKHHTPIDGANDGASSIGVMLEIARQLKLSEQRGDSSYFSLHPNVGIDLICWDAEDSGTPVWAEGDEETSSTWCLGSQHWAGHRHIDGYSATFGINLDMVGGSNTVFFKEQFSVRYAPTLVDKVWGAAERIGYGKYFSYDNGGFVTDDHVQVNQGGIPCIDVIGNDKDDCSFPKTWHTMNDNIDNIDKATLKAVGQTMLEVLWCEY